MEIGSFARTAGWIYWVLLWLIIGRCTLSLPSEDIAVRREVAQETVSLLTLTQTTIPPSAINPPYAPTQTTPKPTRNANSTPIPTFTLTPEPTLEPEKSLEFLTDLLQTNGACEFPCVWGITPGLSDVETVRHLGLILGKVSTENFEIASHWEQKGSYINFIIYKRPLETTFSFEHIGDPIDYLLLSALERLGQQNDLLKYVLGYYQLSNVLTFYGKPFEVFIGPWWRDPADLMIGHLSRSCCIIPSRDFWCSIYSTRKLTLSFSSAAPTR